MLTRPYEIERSVSYQSKLDIWQQNSLKIHFGTESCIRLVTRCIRQRGKPEAQDRNLQAQDICCALERFIN